MNANLEKKHKVVSELSEKFKSSGATFVADYKGCSCQELTDLRAKLTEKGASMAVVKNTLAKRAVEGTESEKLLDCLLYTSPSPRDATLSRMPSSA